MIRDELVDRIVAALWPAAGQRPTVSVGPGEVDGRWAGPGEPATGRALAAALRSKSPPDVVVLAEPDPVVWRALREQPPSLLVLLASDAAPAALPPTRPTLVLGPGARVTVGPLPEAGGLIATAHSADELAGLCRALGGASLGLAVSPTPPWLVRLLQHPRLAGARVAGYVPAEALHLGWIPWARAHEDHVLVPVGVGPADLDRDDSPTLAAAAAAHALERRTGPVFPAPRVVSLLLAGLRNDRPAPAQLPPAPLTWVQARRALPITGSTPGMEAPDPALPLDAPTAAFLAQRVLLRARTVAEIVARADALGEPTPPPDDGVDRAHEVLRSAGERLTDQESKVVLRGFGLEVTRQAVANSASGASGFAERIGFPVVLKALSPDLRRRTDVGGVVLGLETAAAVRRAYGTIVENMEREAPTARLDGVLVAEMVSEGLDIRCGGRRLDGGEVLLYGRLEGTQVAVETVLGLVPLRPEDALELAHAVISRAPVPALRRQTDPDTESLALLFSRLGRLFAETEDRLLSVDLGPVRWVGPPRGYVTLDASIVQRPHLQGL